MANRPTRPWLRLASISSLGAGANPAPPPAPAPPPPPVQPIFRPQEPPPPPPSAPAPVPKPTSPEPTQPQNSERTSITVSPPPPQPALIASSLRTSPTLKIPSPPPKKEETAPPALLPSRSPPPPSPPPAAPAPEPVRASPEIKPIQPSPGAFKTRSAEKKSPPKMISPKAPPPSPLTLPPSQIQDHKEQHQQLEPQIPEVAEQKTVMEVQKSQSRTVHAPPKDDNIRKIKHHEAMHKEKSLSPHHHQHHHPGHRVITIAGENKGAVMELIRSPRNQPHHGHPPTASGPPRFLHETSSGKGSTSESGSDSDEKQKQMQHMKKNHKFGNTQSHSLPMNAFMNSNVQGINNSIVYNGSCTHNDPGVHLYLTRKPTSKGGRFKVWNNGKGDH